ncbi:hypothetical protein HZH66_008942 [Vespula vulgaris]|uniref:Uncharacterized protein n=1 Tax=Vespula vulgaris TaxID=7454 RepID=A0A834N2Z2_VESVU|nr:hypothetical protein HZH66_008942 [Vespula vulgaris]
MALARKRRDGLGGEGGIKRGIILKYGQIKTAGYDLRDVPLVRRQRALVTPAAAAAAAAAATAAVEGEGEGEGEEGTSSEKKKK